MSTQQRIAIVGGGLSSLIAAFELTCQPRARERYHIQVYQMGWRRGASARPAEMPRRINASKSTAFTYGAAFTRTLFA